MSRRNRRSSPPPAPPPPAPIQDENASAAAVTPIASTRTDTQHPSPSVGKTVSHHGPQYQEDDSAQGPIESVGGSRNRSVVIPAGSSHVEDVTHLHAAAPTDVTSLGTLRPDPRQAQGRSRTTPEQSSSDHRPSQRAHQSNRQYVRGTSDPPSRSDSQLTAGDLVPQHGVRTATGQEQVGAHLRPQRLTPSSSSRSPVLSHPSADQRRYAAPEIAQQTEFNDVPQSHQHPRHEGIASQGHEPRQLSSQPRRSASPSRTSSRPRRVPSTASAHPRRSSPLRSLTPSSSLPNLPSSEAAAPIDQSEGPFPSSSSASTLPTSHSYPFLAEPPPERASVRQKRRLASMPSGSTGRRSSRSRSPPAALPASPPRSLRPRRQSRSSPRRVVSSSSSSSKREREEPESGQQSSSSAAARGPQSSSKRRASGSSVPIVSRRSEEGHEEDQQKPDPDPTAPSSHPLMDIQGRKYEMIILQQPTRGCAFGSNLLSRLPCAPPLIVQLKVTDEDGSEVPSDAEEPFLVCHASLFTSEGQPADLISPVQSTHTSPSGSTSHQMSPPAVAGSSTSTPTRRSPQSRRQSRGGEGEDQQPSGSGASARSRQDSSATATSSGTAALPRGVPSTPVRMLYGSLAATAQRFNAPSEDLSTSASASGAVAAAPAETPAPSSSPPSIRKPYFIFPEICVRARGQYQLKLSLMRLPRRLSSTSATRDRDTPTGSDLLATTFTSPFEVFLAHQYTVPYVTDLTRFFARQGAALPLPSGD